MLEIFLVSFIFYICCLFVNVLYLSKGTFGGGVHIMEFFFFLKANVELGSGNFLKNIF